MTVEKINKLAKKLIRSFVAVILCGAVLITALCFQIAFTKADYIICWRPDYEKREISAILDKQILSDEDYGLIYAQTGLTEIGVDRMLEKKAGKSRILKLQEQYFAPHEVKNGFFAPFVCTDYIGEHITPCYTDYGDIIVTSSTHFAGWRIGHAGLVVNSTTDSTTVTPKVLQANAVGSKSRISNLSDFTDRVNFMILRPKCDRETKKRVAEYAINNLQGKVYDFTVGFFTDKNDVEKTQCAHLVWYVYNMFGIDLDSNGGRLVSPKDIAASPYVEIVQIFGFDPQKLYE